jgi:hypothetical protein
MFRIRPASTALLVVLGGLSTHARAQQITVQQPVVQQFSATTVVSVPDRGSLLLGGVSRAGDASNRAGLAPFGSSFGVFRDHASLSVGVTVHDLAAMDEDLLSQPTASPRPSTLRPGTRAGDAWHALQNRSRAKSDVPEAAFPAGSPARPSAGAAPVTNAGPPQTDDRGELAAFYLAKARAAESRGKTSVAQLCYRMAERYGAPVAPSVADR